MTRPRLFSVLAALMLSAGMPIAVQDIAAQDTQSGLVTLTGTVTDTAGRPVEDADVAVLQLQRRFRTGPDGKFVFNNIKPGKFTLTTRRIGYVEDTKKISVSDKGGNVQIPLKRAAFALPSMITTAERGGLSGVIADTAYRPMAGVKINVIGTTHVVESDSTGAFFTPVPPGHYLVDVTRNGYDRQLISVTVPRDAGRKIAAWMVPQTGKPNPMIGANLYEMRVRLIRGRAATSRYYTREDIELAGWTELREVASVAAGRLMNPNCPVLINGGPQKRELWEITTREVEFIETYEDIPSVPKVNAPRPGDITVEPSTNALPTSACGTALVVWLRR